MANDYMLDLTPQQLIRKKASGESIFPGDRPSVHKHVISVALENTVGALIRVINLFSSRGFNLESVAVGPTEDPTVSRVILVTTGNDRIIAQIIRQLDRLVDTLDVEDLTERAFVERELCLLKVGYTPETRKDIMTVVEIFRGRVVDMSLDAMIIEVTGPAKKINAFIDLMRPFHIQEVSRSGRIAMQRSSEETESIT